MKTDIKNKTKKHKNILLLDFAQETNSGDAAMQMSIQSLAKKFFPDSILNISTVFGFNQFPEATSQFSYASQDVAISKIVGGIHPTYYTLNSGSKKGGKFKKIVTLLTTLLTLLFIKFKLFRFLFKKVIPKSLQETFEVYEKADFIIWNGRNFRGGGNWASDIYKIIVLYLNPLFCIMLNKPMVCVGASVWKMDNYLSIKITRYVFKKCLFVSVRESQSYEIVKNMMGSDFSSNRLFYFPDLSLYTLKKRSQNFERKKQDENLIGLTVVSEREIGDSELNSTYINSVSYLVQYLYKKGFKITVVPQVTFNPEDSDKNTERIRKISDVPSSHFSVTKQELDVDGLLEIYADMSFIIASRMHSAIFALNVCTPAIALAYDEGSKWKILEDIGMPQSQIINVSKLPTVSLEKEFNDAWERRDNVMTKVNNNLDKYLYEDTEKHFVYARKFYDKYFQKK